MPSSPTECKRLVKLSAKQRNGESARDWSASQMHTNPNCYFYRHNAPDYEQWTGDWTVEETALFLRVAQEFGCGDRWGLFSSHVPHRFGYQCSNFYR
jgi:Myb-like DNA-binding domain